MYVMEIGCLLLSVLGVFGACKGKRWCLILVKNKNKKSYICAGIYLKRKYACVKMCSKFVLCVCVCVQYATGMAAASQTIIIRTALSYQDVYEVWYMSALLFFIDPVVRVALSAVRSM